MWGRCRPVSAPEARSLAFQATRRVSLTATMLVANPRPLACTSLGLVFYAPVEGRVVRLSSRRLALHVMAACSLTLLDGLARRLCRPVEAFAVCSGYKKLALRGNNLPRRPVQSHVFTL